jgi:predicted O-linked N-acetylglucosamine transferase (SPINDLY family)
MSGVPLLTLSGETFAARVSGSMLRQLDLEELIAFNAEDYRRRALELAESPAKLLELRTRLIAKLEADTQFTPETHARKLEQAYIELAKSHEK